MDKQAILQLLDEDDVPTEAPLPFQAVWFALHGRWDEAHAIAQDDPSDAGAWIHAWLHRIEGDFSNAAYWYRRAGQPVYAGLIKDEGREIAFRLMGDEQPE